MTPNFTVVTSFCKKNIETTLSQDIYINKLNLLFKLPFYIVVFTEKEFVELFKSKRKEYGFSDITLIVERNFEDFLINHKKNPALLDSSILSCFKFELMLDTIKFNPFNTNKFSWLDAFICEKYSKSQLIKIIENSNPTKFHIMIPDVINKNFKSIENKNDYYSSYKNVVCGGFFTCGVEIGIKILERLNDNFIKTIELGFCSGDEMLYLEIMDEFYDNIEKSYGNYGTISQKLLLPEYCANKIYNNIIQKYLNFHYHRECYECCKQILEKDIIFSYTESHMNILFAYYISSFYYNNNESLEIIKKIYNICKINSSVNKMFNNNKGFYESQFNFINGYNTLKIELEKELEIKLKKYNYKIIISICVSGKNYYNEIIKINKTWGKKCEQLGIKVLFFLGEEKTDLIDDKKYIYLDGIYNDYDSLRYKQSLAFKYIYDNYDFDYIYTSGTETYLNIDNLLQYLNTLNKTKDLYIGGYGDFKKIGDNYIYFHIGETGVVLTKSIIIKLYPILNTINEEWKQICINKNMNDLISEYDILLGYYLNKLNCEIVKNDFFYSYKCSNIKIKDFISCQYKNILNIDEDNNIFINCIDQTNISEYLPILYNYAYECKNVFVTNINELQLCWAFVYGLLNSNNNSKKQLFLNNILSCNTDELLNYTKKTNLEFSYEWIHNLKLEIKQNYDITFIDLSHNYEELKKTLAKFCNFTNKYFIIHNTSINETNCKINFGTWKAIEDFLINNPEWKIKERYYNNNGLTILKKI
jgi:hypothetical protein